MKRQEALRIVGMFAAAHPAWKATEATVELWCDLLADLPAAEASKAAKRLVASSDDWPSIARVRRAVAAELGLLPPTLDVAVRQFIDRAKGRTTDLHPLVDETVQALGGWYQIRTASNVGVLVGQFRQLYEPAEARMVADATEDPTGMAELQAPERRELTS